MPYETEWKERTKVATILAGRFMANLKECRMMAGLSQGELARRAKIPAAYVSQLESGQRAPSLAMVEQVAKALEVDPKVLLS